MNFIHLNYVMEIAKQGSISKAAKHLYITQPYLSRILKEVERELKLTLFVRTPQGIAVTPQGQEFIERAEAILREFNELQENLTESPRMEQHSFKVTAVRSSIVMEAYLELIREYEEKDELKFTYNESGGMDPLHDIVYHRSDLSIMYSPSGSLDHEIPSHIVYEKICDLQFSIVLSVNHPLLKLNQEISLDMLADYPFVFYEEESLPFRLTENEDVLMTILKLKDHPKNIIVNSRAAFNNVLSHTNSFSIGSQAGVDQENLFNIASLPLDLPEGFQASFEMGVLYRKEDKYNNILNEFLKKLKDRYSK